MLKVYVASFCLSVDTNFYQPSKISCTAWGLHAGPWGATEAPWGDQVGARSTSTNSMMNNGQGTRFVPTPGTDGITFVFPYHQSSLKSKTQSTQTYIFFVGRKFGRKLIFFIKFSFCGKSSLIYAARKAPWAILRPPKDLGP